MCLSMEAALTERTSENNNKDRKALSYRIKHSRESHVNMTLFLCVEREIIFTHHRTICRRWRNTRFIGDNYSI